jgi:hypothetical protein
MSAKVHKKGECTKLSLTFSERKKQGSVLLINKKKDEFLGGNKKL